MLETLKELIVMYTEIDPEEIGLCSGIRSDLGLNSLVLMNLVVEIEERFGVEIPEEVALDFETVGDVVAFLEAAKK